MPFNIFAMGSAPFALKGRQAKKRGKAGKTKSTVNFFAHTQAHIESQQREKKTKEEQMSARSLSITVSNTKCTHKMNSISLSYEMFIRV